MTPKSAFDGINRFYVSDAQDLDHFEIPVERSRFNVPVSAAGSMSTGFVAEPGLGKVDLTWTAIDTIDVEDVIGYNVYRYTVNDQSVASDTLRVNDDLIMLEDGVYEGELSFTDFDVTPGTTYYYYYRALRSTLDSTEPSMTVAATPATSAKGDANGSADVTVADVVSLVNSLTGQNPQPFIFEAADVNSDQVVNILDIVGTINIVMKTAGVRPMNALATATYSVEDGLLYIDSPVSLAGLQLLVSNDTETLTPTHNLNGMEYASCVLPVEGDLQSNVRQFLSYSLAGRTIPAGHRAVLRIGDAEVLGLVLSDEYGSEGYVSYDMPREG